MFEFLRPAPLVMTKYIAVPTHVPYVKTTVDPRMGKKQLDQIKKAIDMKKYKIGDTLESVAYRQGKQDLFEYIEKNIMGGKL